MSPLPLRRNVGRNRAAVALIFVLGFIALLALLITGLMDTLRVRLVDGEMLAQRTSLKADADSALAVARARLAVFKISGEGILLSAADLERFEADPLAGWTPPDGATVTVRLRDECGLFPLNVTDSRRLAELFEDLGVTAARAASLADALADWTDADDRMRPEGAEAAAYGVPGMPANRPLRSFSELRLVKGFAEIFFDEAGRPNESGRELAAVCSLRAPAGKPNVNTAPAAVLRLLALRTGADPEAILAFRAPLDYPNERTHGGVLASADKLGLAGAPSALAERITYASTCIRVTVTVTKGDLRHVEEALLVPRAGDADFPVGISVRAEGLMPDATAPAGDPGGPPAD